MAAPEQNVGIIDVFDTQNVFLLKLFKSFSPGHKGLLLVLSKKNVAVIAGNDCDPLGRGFVFRVYLHAKIGEHDGLRIAGERLLRIYANLYKHANQYHLNKDHGKYKALDS
jgi:hypothetical protein